jgi:hypothetical protein
MTEISVSNRKPENLERTSKGDVSLLIRKPEIRSYGIYPDCDYSLMGLFLETMHRISIQH